MGEILALSCAVFWAFAVIFIKRAGESVAPFPLNLFRVLFSLPLFLVTLGIRRQPLFPPAPAQDYLILAASGIIAIAIADTLFHWSLNRVGAGITAIVDTFYSPMMVLFAFLLLDERIDLRDFIGMALIMSAVLLSGTLTPPAGCTRRKLLEGIALGMLGLALLSFGIVIAKPVLNHSSVLWAAFFRQAASGVALLAATLVSPRRREYLAVLKPNRSWKWMVPGTILGSYLSLICWIGGMKYTLASISGILTQTSTVFILVLSVFFLHERMTKRKLLSAMLAFSGVLLVTTH